MNTERFQELMVKVTDGTATPAEREELMAWVGHHPELARELESHQALKAVTDGWMARLEHDLVLDRGQGRSRLLEGLGVVLLLGGMALLLGYGLVELALDPSAPLAVKAGLGALTAGFVLLIYTVARWRLRMLKSDPYREVIR